MTTPAATPALVAGAAQVCGDCGARMLCGECAVDNAVAAARQAILDVVKGNTPRNAQARVQAAKLILAKDFLAYLTDEELLAEMRRRTDTRRAASPMVPR